MGYAHLNACIFITLSDGRFVSFNIVINGKLKHYPPKIQIKEIPLELFTGN